MEQISLPVKLHLACKNGDLAEVKSLVEEKRVNPRSEECKDPQLGASPLSWAAREGHLDVVRYLVEEKKCDVMGKNKYGDPLINDAALSGHLRLVQYLINEKGCNPESRGWESRTPLHCACRNGHLAVAKFLIKERGVYPSLRDEFDSTPLHTAAQFGTLEVAKYLIEEERCDMLSKNKSGGTSLSVASLGGKLDTIQYLISEKGFDPMSKGLYGRIPLHYACGHGHLSVIKYFIDTLNVDPSVRDMNNSNPLHLTAQFGTLEVAKYLVEEKKCDVMCRGEYGRTSLHYACRNKDINVAKYFIDDEGVDPSCRDADDSTPLHIAAQLGSLEVVKYLIEEKNCDLMCRDKYKKTPLDAAAVIGKLDTVRYLIEEKGCDPMSPGKDNRVTLHWACQSGHMDIVKYLIDDRGVDPLCPDADGITTLHLASLTGHAPVVKLLIEEYQCDSSVKDKYGNVPLDVAIQYNKQQVISYLSALQKNVSDDLHRALVNRLKPYIRNARPTGVELGSGTYGSVIELLHCGEIVAGKKFKINISAADMQALTDKLLGEMILMMQIRHPNIVESKGVCFIAKHPLPVLLMERLMSSLHAYIQDPVNLNLQLTRKISFLRDVATGVCHLHDHVPVIIHRDLTAKNVLLDTKLNAKICDFGNSRVMDLDPDVTPESFTSLPGTLDYMPPEALGERSEYDPSLDMFSFGHLALFTVTQSSVKVLPPTYNDEYGLHARSEVKRRYESIYKIEDMLGAEHKVLFLIKQCLHNRPAQRPHAKELVKALHSILSSMESTYEQRISEQDVLSATPRLSELVLMRTPKGEKVEIIESVAVEWRRLGTMLDFDSVGNRLKLIASEERDKPEPCCQSMFQYWLSGKGVQPATWGRLIQMLEDCHFIAVAQKVKEALQIDTDTKISGQQ